MQREIQHTEALQRLCRFCGTKAPNAKLRFMNELSTNALSEQYGIDVNKDDPYQFPTRICLTCMLHLKRLTLGPKEKKRTPFVFPAINHKTRNKTSCDESCSICYEGKRLGLQKSAAQLQGSVKSKKGRPSQQSPIESRCNKCWNVLKNNNQHVCGSKQEGLNYLEERIKKKGLADPLLGRLYREKKPGDPIRNLHGKPTILPTEIVMQKVKMNELIEVITKAGGKGGLSRNTIRVFRTLLSKYNVKLPSEDALYVLKKGRVSDLFDVETEPMEYGKKYHRELKDTEIVYCTDVIEIIHRCKSIHDIDTDDKDLKVKIGLDSGQQITKMTIQILDIATNSVNHTIVIAATPAPETTNNLKTIINKVDFENVSSQFEIGISSDVKVIQILFGIMGGNAAFPCPLCLWPSSKGLCVEDFPDRTHTSLMEAHTKLTNVYQGDSKKFAIKCHGTEALPLVTADPKDIVKIPTLHLNLLVNTIYDHVRTKSSEEELLVFSQDCRASGVRETKYHGHSLEGRKSLL